MQPVSLPKATVLPFHNLSRHVLIFSAICYRTARCPRVFKALEYLNRAEPSLALYHISLSLLMKNKLSIGESITLNFDLHVKPRKILSIFISELPKIRQLLEILPDLPDLLAQTMKL